MSDLTPAFLRLLAAAGDDADHAQARQQHRVGFRFRHRRRQLEAGDALVGVGAARGAGEAQIHGAAELSAEVDELAVDHVEMLAREVGE